MKNALETAAWGLLTGTGVGTLLFLAALPWAVRALSDGDPGGFYGGVYLPAQGVIAAAMVLAVACGCASEALPERKVTP